MPIPTPKSEEKEKDFISRCISTLTKAEDYDSHDQRIAVCYTTWRNKKGNTMKKNEESVIEIQEEIQIPGTDVILEKGDKIRILEAKAPQMGVNKKAETARSGAITGLNRLSSALTGADNRAAKKTVEGIIKKIDNLNISIDVTA